MAAGMEVRARRPSAGPEAICPNALACPSTENSVARVAGSSDWLSHARWIGSQTRAAFRATQ